jgi:predicted phosphodiesterase
VNAESTPESSPKKKSYFRLAAIIVGLALVVSGKVAYDASKPVLIAGPMVQLPAPNSISIIWQMRSPLKNAEVTLTGPGVNLVSTSTHIDDYHEAVFEGLPAGANLTYQITVASYIGPTHEVSGPTSVKTPPRRGESFRFAVLGDSGNGSNTQTELAALLTAQKPDVVIHVGDLVYPSGSRDDYLTNFFEPNAELIRSVPFMPSLGNHDVATRAGAPFLEVFSLPKNGPPGLEPERNYYFDFGDAHFVSLDSNPTDQQGVITNDQRKTVVAPWVKHTFSACGSRWKFAYYHHPYYTNSEHSAEGSAFMKDAFLKVFEESGVDIIFCGHNHLYERTAPILSDVVVPDGKGIVYVTCGAGGVSRYKEHLPPPPYMRAYNDSLFSFSIVDVTPTKLSFRQMSEKGEIIDQFTIEKPAPAM